MSRPEDSDRGSADVNEWHEGQWIRSRSIKAS